MSSNAPQTPQQPTDAAGNPVLRLFCLNAGTTRSRQGVTYNVSLSSQDDYGNNLNPGVSGFQYSFSTQDERIGAAYEYGKTYDVPVVAGQPYESPQAAAEREQRAQQQPAQPGTEGQTV